MKTIVLTIILFCAFHIYGQTIPASLINRELKMGWCTSYKIDKVTGEYLIRNSWKDGSSFIISKVGSIMSLTTNTGDHVNLIIPFRKIESDIKGFDTYRGIYETDGEKCFIKLSVREDELTLEENDGSKNTIIVYDYFIDIGDINFFNRFSTTKIK